MYAESIIARRVANYEQATKTKLREVPLSRVVEIKAYLEGHINAKGEPVRPTITPELRSFISNELAMCKSSFIYWARRYATIEFRVGHGGIGLFTPLESQMVLLEKMAMDEVDMWYRKDQGDTHFAGLCYIIHKARQLGFTTLCQLLLLHLNIFYSNYKSLSASTDDQKTQDMHGKWVLAYNALPYWMKTPIEGRSKDRGKWLVNGSYCALQDFAQEGGLGQGMTWSGLHMTELAKVDDAYCTDQIQNHLLPSLADTIRVVAFMESTAQGADNWWHKIWKQVDAGNFGRWHKCFVPAYAEPNRWSRGHVPLGWEPSEETRKYGEEIERTSHKYMNGQTITPTRNHLLWYEEERQIAIDTGTYNLFLANYCVTPEESFQHSEGGAFNSLVVSSLKNRCDKPAVAYELVTTAAQRQAVRERREESGRTIAGGLGDLVPVRTTPRDVSDPRGLIMLFEPPRIDVVYSIGIDPAGGIVGWDRRFRSDRPEELRRDNAVISGWYRDPATGLLVQAFEFAGPIAPREFAVYAAVLGRVYSGANGPEMGATLIVEANAGGGGMEVQNVLVNDLKYYNLWQRTKFNGAGFKQIDQWGWQSTMQSKQQLWVVGKDLIEQPGYPVRPRSQYLIEEMIAARWDVLKLTGSAASDGHDDRISAMLFALWQLRGFLPIGGYGEAAKRIVDQQKRTHVEFQNMDIASAEEYAALEDAWYDRVLYGK